MAQIRGLGENAMYRAVGHFFALPGKVFELTAVLHEARTLAKKINKSEAAILRPVGGMVSHVVYVTEVESLDQHEKNTKNLESNDEYRKLFAKAGAVVVPNTAKWEIYRVE